MKFFFKMLIESDNQNNPNTLKYKKLFISKINYDTIFSVSIQHSDDVTKKLFSSIDFLILMTNICKLSYEKQNHLKNLYLDVFEKILLSKHSNLQIVKKFALHFGLMNDNNDYTIIKK